MNVEEYLKQQYPNASIKTINTSDGSVAGYYLTMHKQFVYVPANAANNSNLNMVSYLPGAGGAGNDAKQLRNRIVNNPPNYIISIASECFDGKKCLETGYNIATGLNSKVNQNVTVCFSASGYMGLTRTEEFLENHPEVKSTVISSEPYRDDKFNQNNISALKQTQTPIVFVAPDSGFHYNMLDRVKQLKESGLNTYLLETDYKSNAHIATNADVLSGGIIDYVLGLQDSFDTTRAGGYDFLKYDTTSNKFVNADYSEISGNGTIAIPTLEGLNSTDGFTIQTVDSPVNQKYSALKSLPTLGDASLVEFSSDYGIVKDAMNNIRSMISSSSCLGGISNFGFRSSSGIPGCIGAYINAYFDIVGSLLNSISLQTESVVSYAEATVKMDKELAEDANKGKSGTLTVQDNSGKIIPIGLEEESVKTEESTESTPQETPNNSESTAGNQNITPRGSNPPAGEPTVTPPENQGVCFDESIKPNYIYKLNGYDAYIYMNGDQIIGIKYRYTFKDAATSISKLNEIKEQYKNSSFIKEVIATDKYVDVIFKEDVLKNQSLQTIVTQYIEGGNNNG